MPGGHISSSGNAPFTGSTRFHNELSEIIMNSTDFEDFWSKLPEFSARWRIDPEIMRELFDRR